MVKMKILYAFCKICEKQISLSVPVDLAKNRDFYPFEYLDIHGEPEHALMLFLDHNLAVRSAIAYSDLRIVRKKKNQYKNLIQMSEIDSLTSIYTEPIRLALFSKLTQGPWTEENLINQLRNMENFIEEEFPMLILPFIRTGLVKTEWLQDSFEMCYFLVKDFSVLRGPAKITSRIFQKDERFRPFRDYYFEQAHKVLSEYKKKFLTGEKSRKQQTQFCLEVRSVLKYFSIYNSLWTGPQKAEVVKGSNDPKVLDLLLDEGFITLIKTKTDSYFALLTDIIVKKFTPTYLTDMIAQRLSNREINREIASKHLEFLFESDAR